MYKGLYQLMHSGVAIQFCNIKLCLLDSHLVTYLKAMWCKTELLLEPNDQKNWSLSMMKHLILQGHKASPNLLLKLKRFHKSREHLFPLNSQGCEVAVCLFLIIKRSLRLKLRPSSPSSLEAIPQWPPGWGKMLVFFK